MKTAILRSVQVNGLEMDILLVEDEKSGARHAVPFHMYNGFLIQESSSGFSKEVIESWWDQAENQERENRRFLDAVSDLVAADEARTDTSFSARTIRNHFVYNLDRKDPLGCLTKD